MPAEFQYKAFISYRHLKKDEKWASWLLDALETYRVPGTIQKKGYPKRLGKIFRDEDEIPMSADLSEQIEQALAASEYLIVVCSPDTPQSDWVCREIELFHDLGRSDKILALLIEGEPDEAFPPQLLEFHRQVETESGETRRFIDAVEPIAADVRPREGRRERELKHLARLRVAAALLGCSFDDLRQRDRQRQQRSRLQWVATVLLFISLGGAYWYQQDTQIQALERERLVEESKRLAAASIAATQQGKTGEGLKLALQALPADPDNPKRPILFQAEHALRFALTQPREVASIVPGVLPDGKPLTVLPIIDGFPFSPNGRYVAVIIDINVRLLDTSTGAVKGIFVHKTHPMIVAFSDEGQRLVTFTDSHFTIWDIASGNQIAEVPHFANDDYVMEVSPGGRYIFIGHGDQTLDIHDGSTGQQIGMITDDWPIDGVAVSTDGVALLIYSRGWLKGQEDAPPVSVWDIATRTKINELALSPPNTTNLLYPILSAKGKYVLYQLSDREFEVWDVHEAQRLYTKRLGGTKTTNNNIYQYNFNTDGSNYVVTAGTEAHIYAASSGRQEGILQHQDQVYRVAFLNGDRWIGTATLDDRIHIWDWKNRFELASTFALDSMWEVKFDAKGDRVIWTRWRGAKLISFKDRLANQFQSVGPYRRDVQPVGNDNIIVKGGRGRGHQSFWNVHSRTVQKIDHGEWIVETVIASGSRHFATLSRSRAKIWDSKTGEAIMSVLPSGLIGGQFVFSPDGQYLAVRSYDGKCRLWNIDTRTSIGELDNGGARIEHIAFTADSKYLRSYGLGFQHLWDVPSGTLSETSPFPEKFSFKPSVHDHFVRTYRRNANARETVFFDSESAEPFATVRGVDNLFIFDISADRKSLIAQTIKNDSGDLQIWALDSSTLLATRKMDGYINEVYYSEDYRHAIVLLLLVGDSKETTHEILWIDLATGETIESLSMNYPAISLSPNGRKALIRTSEHFFVIDFEHRKLLGPAGHPDRHRDGSVATRTAEFSSDSRFVITTAWDGSARIWNSQSLDLTGVLPVEDIFYASFINDDRNIMTVSELPNSGNKGVIQYWKFPPLSEIIPTARQWLPNVIKPDDVTSQ